MHIHDLSQTIEAHWFWDSFPLVSQSYEDGDEFQEFGLRWAGKGFTYSSAPGWHFAGMPSLDDINPEVFASVAQVVDVSEAAASGVVNAGDFTSKIGFDELPIIIVLKTGHADKIPIRRRDYWTQVPAISPAIAEIAADRGVKHICVDFSCDSFISRRTDKTGSIQNINNEFRLRAHVRGLIITENLRGLKSLPPSIFLFSLPIKGESMTTAPSRPVALTSWPSDRPRIYDVSTPLLNHWRWRLEIWQSISTNQDGYCNQTEFIQSGHAFTHCDAPRHMKKDGNTIHDLPNMGLDLFIGSTIIIDLSDIELPSPITTELLKQHCPSVIKDNTRVILRTDLTNRLGYKSTCWHTHAPHLEIEATDWLLSHKPAVIGLDFPQDKVAREMPHRHVYNHEFVVHHKVFSHGVPFIEDLKDLGELPDKEVFMVALPLKMNCVDGAPMRAFILDW